MAETMRDRLLRFLEERGCSPQASGAYPVNFSDTLTFAESELRRAQQPAAPSAELAALRMILEADRNEILRLRAITEHCRQCGVAFSERAEMADTGLCVTCEGRRDEELRRLRATVERMASLLYQARARCSPRLRAAVDAELDQAGGKAGT